MNDYQFWDELGKIFNAVIAYQEKAVEFNKRFINPWIPLGNVFDQRERNTDAIRAYHTAIELDPKNAQNWYELGNVHFRMKSFEEAAEAYRQAIEIAPAHGSAYSNLALTLANQGRLAESIPLYQKSIELLEDDKEKAVAWNRLGNVHRKLNEYALAVEAFQKADELDAENAGFKDDLEEAPNPPPVREGATASAPEATAVESLDPLQFIVAQGRVEDHAAALRALAETRVPSETVEPEPQPTEVNIVASELAFTPDTAAEVGVETTAVEAPGSAAGTDGTTDGQGGAAEAAPVVPAEQGPETPQAEPANANLEAAPDVPMSVYAAYEEYLRDNDQAIHFTVDERLDEAEAQPEATQHVPAAKVDASGELQIEMDTRNAHVWNELGNIYFNNGQFDDAVIAYSKAIELDRWFAWPYSNLALTYVQKNRFSEAILLYQRSIELFQDAKDQAISWNRLGNVYRRLNDYEHAIAAYQRADDLDPDNATLSLQSRFSLLGNFAAEPKPSLVS